MLKEILLVLAVAPLLIVLWASALYTAKKYLGGHKAAKDAALEIRAECRKREICRGCPFCNTTDYHCKIGSPTTWKL